MSMLSDADRDWARNLAISLGVESFSFDEAADMILAALDKRDAELSRPATPTIVCPHCNAELGEYPLWATLCHHVAQRCTGPLREKRSGK